MKQEQEELFYESAEEAIRGAIVKSARKPKEIAIELWPHMKMDSAYARLQNALNPDKPEKLTFDEIILICRRCGRFDPLYYMADELNHTRPQIRAPQDEMAELQMAFIKAQKDLGKILERMERTQSRPIG